eukprot:6463649-Amphidinium_carterae.3
MFLVSLIKQQMPDLVSNNQRYPGGGFQPKESLDQDPAVVLSPSKLYDMDSFDKWYDEWFEPTYATPIEGLSKKTEHLLTHVYNLVSKGSGIQQNDTMEECPKGDSQEPPLWLPWDHQGGQVKGCQQQGSGRDTKGRRRSLGCFRKKLLIASLGFPSPIQKEKVQLCPLLRVGSFFVEPVSLPQMSVKIAKKPATAKTTTTTPTTTTTTTTPTKKGKIFKTSLNNRVYSNAYNGLKAQLKKKKGISEAVLVDQPMG